MSEMDEGAVGLSGRRAQAARNDTRILDSARAVFLADPEAPIAAVAAHAGVGISALYRRYATKHDLVRALARDGLDRQIVDLQTALASEDDPWIAYTDCLHRIVEGESQALAQRLAGTFPPTPEMAELATTATALSNTLYQRVRDAGALRRDIGAADIVLLLEAVMLVELPGPGRGAQLRHRYLALLLQALHSPAQALPLPGTPPEPGELAARWQRR